MTRAAGASVAQVLRNPVLVNVVLYQAGWFACVLGAAQGRSWPALLLVGLMVAGWLLTAPQPRALALLIALTGTLGLCWDSVLAALGLIGYAPGPLTPPLAPAWILALWLLFATTLNVSLRWLQTRLAAAAVLGALAAPLAYLGAARLGAVTLPHAAAALWAQAGGWALLLPLLLFAARRLHA